MFILTIVEVEVDAKSQNKQRWKQPKNAKDGPFWRFFENATFLVIFNHCAIG